MSLKAVNFKMDEKEITEVKHVASVFNMSFTALIREAVKEYVSKLEKDPFYRLSSNVEEASPEESEEVLEALDSLSDDDLSIASGKRFEY